MSNPMDGVSVWDGLGTVLGIVWAVVAAHPVAWSLLGLLLVIGFTVWIFAK